MIYCGNRVLPQQGLLRNERAQVAGDWPHVAVCQLEPRLGERVCELLRMLVEAPRNLFVSRVEPQGEVRGQHRWGVTLGWIVRIRHRTGACAILRSPLMRAGRALGQFPFVAEQIGEEVIAPLRRRRRPDDFQAAANRVAAFARAEFALPAEPLLLDAGRFRLWAHQCRIAGTVGLAKGVPAGNQRHCLFVVHRHAGEGLSNIPCRGDGIRIAIGSFRIHVNQAHLNRAERILKLDDRRCSARRASHLPSGPQ